MKKIFLALMCLFPLILFGQGTELSTAPKCWTVPAVFTADEEVTFYYDMTDVGFISIYGHGNQQSQMLVMVVTLRILLNWSTLVTTFIRRL